MFGKERIDKHEKWLQSLTTELDDLRKKYNAAHPGPKLYFVVEFKNGNENEPFPTADVKRTYWKTE